MLHAFRALFVAVCALLGWGIGDEVYRIPAWQGAAFGGGAGFCIVALELAFARRFISVISVLLFGLVAGFVLSHFVITALNLIPGLRTGHDELRDLGIAFVFSFICILAILHAKDDFKLVIPFVELKREGAGGRSLLLDSSAVIDGRVADLMESGWFDGTLVIPRFVLDEVQAVADSTDRVKRARGRRGLDVLNRLRRDHAGRIVIQDAQLPDVQGVDAKLVHLAKRMDARIVTTDYNLGKVAELEGVGVLNLNDVAQALRPTRMQGDRVSVRIARPGENAGQGVGYLEDGTMVVAEDCASRIGQDVELVITNIVQTSAGRLLFARPAPASEVPNSESALPGRAPVPPQAGR